MTPNEQLLNAQTLHAVGLERYKAGTVRKIIALLNNAESDLIETIAARLIKIERGFDLSKANTKRLEGLLKAVREDRSALYAALKNNLSDEVVEFARLEVATQIAMSKEALGAAVVLNRPALSNLKTIALSQPFRGRLLREWAASLEASDVRRVSDAIKVGIVEGQTTDQIVRRIRGTRAQKYKNGILETSRRETQTIVRTAIAHVANRSRESLWSENKHLIEGVQWVSVLDSRTSAVCRSRDNNLYPVNSGPRPPAHFNCRSIVVAAFKDSIPDTRASSMGPIPASRSYEDWLRAQSKDVQEDILGVKKADLFRKGGLSLDRFIDKTGKELTLSELKARNSDLF